MDYALKWFDGISVEVNKKTIRFILQPRGNICNFSIPDKLKLGKVVPVLKKGAKDNLSECRPISVLPVLHNYVQ